MQENSLINKHIGFPVIFFKFLHRRVAIFDPRELSRSPNEKFQLEAGIKRNSSDTPPSSGHLNDKDRFGLPNISFFFSSEI